MYINPTHLSHLCRHRSLESSIVIVSGFEEGVTQCHSLYALHVHIIEQIRVQVEENGHVHSLARIETLLLEAETLDLTEVRRTLGRCHTVGSNSDDVLVTFVGGLVESQCGLTGENSHFSLLRDELPGQDIGDRGTESDFDSLGVSNGDDSACEIAFVA